MIKILFVCHGNICRSTMAESVMTYLVKQAGLSDQFYINSAATSREEIGNPPHHGTVARLKAEGIPVIPHRAVQMTLDDYEEYDYLIGMDTENIRNMQRISGGDPDEKIYKLLTFAGSSLHNQPLHLYMLLQNLLYTTDLPRHVPLTADASSHNPQKKASYKSYAPHHRPQSVSCFLY